MLIKEHNGQFSALISLFKIQCTCRVLNFRLFNFQTNHFTVDWALNWFYPYEKSTQATATLGDCERESGTRTQEGKGKISLLHEQLHKTRNALLRRWVTSSGGINETETEAHRWPLQSFGFGHLPGRIERFMFTRSGGLRRFYSDGSHVPCDFTTMSTQSHITSFFKGKQLTRL